jgi:hypothetical protein
VFLGVSEKGDQVAVDVVDDFKVARRLGEEHGPTSKKRLAVTGMWRDQWQNVFKHPRFSAGPSGDWFSRRKRVIVRVGFHGMR